MRTRRLRSNRRFDLVTDLGGTRARILTLSALALSAMISNRTSCPETMILDERLRAITRDADVACTLTMFGVVDLVA